MHISQCIISGSQGRNLESGLKQKPWKNSGLLLMAFSAPFLCNSGPPGQRWHSLLLKKTHYRLAHIKSDGDLCWLFSSQMILVCIKLKNRNQTQTKTQQPKPTKTLGMAHGGFWTSRPTPSDILLPVRPHLWPKQPPTGTKSSNAYGLWKTSYSNHHRPRGHTFSDLLPLTRS